MLVAALMVAASPVRAEMPPACAPQFGAAAQSTMPGEAAGQPAWRAALDLLERASSHGGAGRQYADQCGGTNFACEEPTPACWFNAGMQRYFCCPRGSTGCAHPQHSWCCAPGSACSAVQLGGCRRL